MDSQRLIKYPCTFEGLKAAQRSVAEGIRVNMTLCFSQQQAAAVYAATKGSKSPVYVSPFIGRLDDVRQNGVDLIRNILQMFAGVACWPPVFAIFSICFIHFMPVPIL